MQRISPYAVLSSSALFLAILCIVIIGLALQAPNLTPNLRLSEQRLVVELDQQQHSIEQLLTPDGAMVAKAELALEEPDVLASYAQLNQFFQQQSQLFKATTAQQLVVVTSDQQHIRIEAEDRHLVDLPWMFWFQLFVGVAGALTGAAIYAFSSPNAATRYYALTGIGYLLFAPSAAIYSSRELILNGDIFRILSAINHFGALFFTASLVALLWHYPSRLRDWPIPALAYAVALLFWLADLNQLWPDTGFVPLSVLLLFSVGIVIAVTQGWRARRHPVDRASFRWFILSIFLGTGLFAAFVLVPTAMNRPMPVSQGLMFGAFLLMYWGLALGLLRYRLFELEAWWFSIWSWFLSGLSIVVIDVLLVSFLSLSGQTALVLAVAMMGWLYFPLRQWVLQRLRRDARQQIDQWLPRVLPLLLDVRLGNDQERQIRQRWPLIIQTVFDPLHLSVIPAVSHPLIQQSGQTLLIPTLQSDPPIGQSLVLHHAARGQRLFTRQDLRTTETLVQLAELALSVARARDTGARLERERIARDIHDDLGARLLYLLQKSAPEQQQIVRETLDDLRGLLSSLDGEDIGLDEAVANWRLETHKRCEAGEAKLDWHTDLEQDPSILTAFEYHHLTRMLREAVTNAFKHSRPSQLWIRISSNPNGLTLQIKNDGETIKHPYSSGRGLENMQRRAQSLDGQITWQQDHHYQILIHVHISHYDDPLITLSHYQPLEPTP